MQAAKLEFWYDFASTYSYLSALRIEALATKAGIEVVWRPFLLGPIFQAQGWTTSPFNLYPAKGRNMWRDLQRQTAARGLEFHVPEPFPQNSLTAARVALVGAEEGWIAAFTRDVYRAQFARRANIADPAVLADALMRANPKLGLESARIFARAADPVIKERLKSQTAEAQALGVFGAPSFRTAPTAASPAGELFWGDDRLEQAVAWAKQM